MYKRQSVNSEVVHGIPSAQRVLKSGDIVSVDFGAVVDGYFGDAAITVPVGAIDEKSARLLKVTEASLHAGIAAVKPGATLGDVGAAVQGLVESEGFSVVRDFVGHGIGVHMHEDPQVDVYKRQVVRRAAKVLAASCCAKCGKCSRQIADDRSQSSVISRLAANCNLSSVICDLL